MDKEMGENLFLKCNILAITMWFWALSYSLHIVMRYHYTERSLKLQIPVMYIIMTVKVMNNNLI
jgi:hypothetical protein